MELPHRVQDVERAAHREEEIEGRRAEGDGAEDGVGEDVTEPVFDLGCHGGSGDARVFTGSPGSLPFTYTDPSNDFGTLVQNADNVGPRFPEEARKMHYGEAEHRSIYGIASPEEAKELHEEGIEFHPLPVLPEERN